MDYKIPFTDDEIMCRCGCGRKLVNQLLMRPLLAARFMSAVPFPINSWNRCPDWNKRVGGADNSAHLTGLAVDIGADDNYNRFHIMRGLLIAGFTRIKLYNGWIHADKDPLKSQEILMLPAP